MGDTLFFSILGVLTACAIALALVWPQGLGDRSPGPFGHVPVQQTEEAQKAIRAEHAAAMQRRQQAIDRLTTLNEIPR